MNLIYMFKSCADTADIALKETPLHIAIKEGHIDVIRILLEKGVSVDVTDVKGNSVYHLAAATNEMIIQVLFHDVACCSFIRFFLIDLVLA